MFARKGEVLDGLDKPNKGGFSFRKFILWMFYYSHGVDLEGSSRFGPKSERTLFGPDQ